MARKPKNSTYVQAPGLSSVEVPQGLVVYADDQKMHYLNHTAAAIFLMCGTPLGAGQIGRIIAEEFGLERAPASEINECLAGLVAAGLLSVTE